MEWTEAEPPERPDLYVVARFLDRLREASPEGVPRTRLQGAVRLNYDLYKSYLSLVLRAGFARISPDKADVEHVQLTPKGRAAHDQLVGWIKDAFGDIRL